MSDKERLDRLESIAEALCEAVLDLAGDRSWADVFDPLQAFRDEIKRERDPD